MSTTLDRAAKEFGVKPCACTVEVYPEMGFLYYTGAKSLNLFRVSDQIRLAVLYMMF